MNKSLIRVIIMILLATAQVSTPYKTYAIVEPLGEGNGREKYGLTVTHTYKSRETFSKPPTLNGAELEYNESHNIFEAYFEYGIKEKTNLLIDVKYDVSEIESRQSVDYIRGGGFEKFIQKDHQNITTKVQIFQTFQQNNHHFALSYGALLPQLYDKRVYSKTYALLLGAGYSYQLPYEVKVEIVPTAGYYPRYSKPYFENKITAFKNIGKYNVEVNLDSYFNDLKIQSFNHLSDLEIYLKFGPINRVIGQMIMDNIFPNTQHIQFIDHHVASIQFSRQIFKNSSAFFKISKVLSGENRFGNSYFTIGFSKEF